MTRIYNDIKYKFFWGGKFSNWSKSPFKINDITFNCGEQYMMYQKAIVFEDYDSAIKILEEVSPQTQKILGRRVKNFNKNKWDSIKYELVKKGLREKFKQNPLLKEYLMEYSDSVIVEASPYDRIWGIGFITEDAIDNIDKWGENLLGRILTELAIEFNNNKIND